MPQCISGTRQLTVYRQRVAAAPVLLECETLSRVNVMQVFQEMQVQSRTRLFSALCHPLDLFAPGVESRRVLPGGGTRLRAFQVAQEEVPCSPNTGSYCKARGRLPEAVVAHLAQEVGYRLRQSLPVPWRGKETGEPAL
jgi:hypothetical protein